MSSFVYVLNNIPQSLFPMPYENIYNMVFVCNNLSITRNTWVFRLWHDTDLYPWLTWLVTEEVQPCVTVSQL